MVLLKTSTDAFTIQQPFTFTFTSTNNPLSKAEGNRKSSSTSSPNKMHMQMNNAGPPAFNVPIPSSPAPPQVAATTKRKSIVAGNWKLNPSNQEEAIQLLQGLKQQAHQQQFDDVDIVIFPPLPFLSQALSILQHTNIQIGAQTSSEYIDGAYTGEIAPSMLASAGCSHILLGHSERRTIFAETDTAINQKLHACLQEPTLTVVLCIGETLGEYEAGLLNSVVDTQLRKGLAGVSAQEVLNDRIIIAYEPVWAIGTGLVATPEQAQAAHVAIRNTLASMYGGGGGDGDVASSVRIQYGGSVKPDSVKELMAMPDVDGTLVGGASLDAVSFIQIVEGSSTIMSSTVSAPPPPPPHDYYLPTLPATEVAQAAQSYTTTSTSTSSSFYSAPISHFSIDKLTSKGPRKNADIGSPHDSTKGLASVGNLKAGSWWCAAGGWPSPNPRDTTEIFYVLEGHACVTDMDGTRNFFGPGDVVVLPKEWSGRWDVLNDIHKVWVVVDHPDVSNVRSDKAIVKPYSSFAPHVLTSGGVRLDATHGTPITASDTYLDNGYMSTGVWTCSPGSFPVKERSTTEAFHVLEGVAFLTNSDGSARRCTAGDTVVLPVGWSGSWDVIESVKKVWVTSSL
jgi:triosephosphate isomerase